MCWFDLVEIAREIAEVVVDDGKVALQIGAVWVGLGEPCGDGKRLLEVGAGGFSVAQMPGEVAEVIREARRGRAGDLRGRVRIGRDVPGWRAIY